MANVNYALIDAGYNLVESWQKVRVVTSRTCEDLFGGDTHEELLVELHSGERIWVVNWKEIE